MSPDISNVKGEIEKVQRYMVGLKQHLHGLNQDTCPICGLDPRLATQYIQQVADRTFEAVIDALVTAQDLDDAVDTLRMRWYAGRMEE